MTHAIINHLLVQLFFVTVNTFLEFEGIASVLHLSISLIRFIEMFLLICNT